MNPLKFATTKNPKGTSYHGSTIKATVSELRDVIGVPVRSSNDGRDKFNFIWDCQNSTGDVFTVYSWKEYRPIDEDEEIIFHIGGHSKSSTERARVEMMDDLELYRIQPRQKTDQK
jgi:hypothetical protein